MSVTRASEVSNCISIYYLNPYEYAPGPNTVATKFDTRDHGADDDFDDDFMVSGVSLFYAECPNNCSISPKGHGIRLFIVTIS